MTEAQRGEKCGKGFIQPEKECRVGEPKSPAPKGGNEKPEPKPAASSKPDENFTYSLKISDRAKKGGYESVLAEVEEQIRHLPHEVAVGIDQETGEVLFSTTGDKASAPIPSSAVKHILSSKGSFTITHNHPNSKPFSSADMMPTFSMGVEMRAISTEYDYSFTPPREFKNNPDPKEALALGDGARREYDAIAQKNLPEFRKKLISGEFKSPDEAEKELFHTTAQEMAKMTGSTYTRTPVKKQKQDSQDAGVDRQISAVIKSVVGKPINLKGYALTQKREVFGVFSAGTQPYRFLANPKTGTFSYVELSEKELKAIGESARQDAKDCDVGKACGDSCVSKGYECETTLSGKAAHALRVAAPLIQPSGSNLVIALAGLVAIKLVQGGVAKYKRLTKKESDFDLKISDKAKKAGVGAVLAEVEDQIKGLPHEVGVAIDEDSGEVLFSRRGDSTSVKMSIHDTYKMVRTPRVVYTHNHPDQKDRDGITKTDGGPFSPGDINAFFASNLKEMRAVSPGATYIIRSSESRTQRRQSQEVDFKSGIAAAKRYGEIQRDLTPKYASAIRSGKYKTVTEAGWALVGETNRQLAKENDYTYQRIAHSPRKDAKDPTVRQAIASNSRLSSVTRQIQAIAKSVYQKPMQIHGYDLDASGKLVGVFSGGGEMYSFSADPKTGSFEYVEANIPKRRADAYMMGWTIDGGFLRYQREDAKCTIGKSCGGTCIERGRKCRIQLSTAARTQLKATAASLQELKSGGAKFPGGAIMKAAIVGAVGVGAGLAMAMATQKKGIAPSQAMPSTVLNPSPLPASTIPGIQDTESRKQLKKFPPALRRAIIAGAITVGVPVGTYIIAREKYRAGFEESAQRATIIGEKFYKTKWLREPVLYNESDADFEDSLPHRNIQERGLTPAKQITFIVGGNDGGDNDLSGEEEAFRGDDGLFDDHRTVAHTTDAAYDERSSVMDRGLIGKFKHDYMNGRNESAVDLSAQIYAFHKHSPDLPINIIGVSGGGIVTHEAAEICKRMGIEVKVINLGSPWFGMTQKVGPSITLNSINDEVTHNPRLPVRDAVNVNSVKHHDGYWENEQARKVMADFINGKPVVGSEKAGDLERKKAERRRRLTKRIKNRNKKNRQQRQA